MSYRRLFNKQVNPAAPFLNVTFTNINNSISLDVESLVDSGADCCLIPQSVARHLGLLSHDLMQTKDFENNPTGWKPVYHVRISFGTRIYEIDMIETNGGAIIGRDILNLFITTLDGPQTQMEIQ